MGDYPYIKTKDARAALPEVLIRLQNNLNAKLSGNAFYTVSDLLNWYHARMNENTNMSEQRKKDIASALKCHLLPKIGDVPIHALDLDTLDKRLIWAGQKQLANPTLLKHLAMLKAAFKDAQDLRMIATNPLIGVTLSSFGEFRIKPKEGKIKPRMVKDLLISIGKQPPKTYVLSMLMLTLGTRIGETRQTRWQHFYLNDDPEWVIPSKITKTKKEHTIKLPPEVASLLKQYRAWQLKRRYKGDIVFLDNQEKGELKQNDAYKLIKTASNGKWASHDLRKAARNCWTLQGVDYFVGEKMLNHSLSKVSETYTNDDVHERRLEALNKHVSWLQEQYADCFNFNKVLTNQ